MNENRKVKQVIVFRKDLINGEKHSISFGKVGSQCSHASMAALLKCFEKKDVFSTEKEDSDEPLYVKYDLNVYKDTYLDKWLNGLFTKIVVGIDNEEKLLKLYEKITTEKPEIPCSLITDCGLTEFNGVPTNTCIGIGPFWSEDIDLFTKRLRLL